MTGRVYRCRCGLEAWVLSGKPEGWERYRGGWMCPACSTQESERALAAREKRRATHVKRTA